MSFMPMRACANIDPHSSTAAPTSQATTGDAKLVVIVIDTEKRSGHGYRRERRRTVDLHDHDAALREGVEELRARHEHKGGGAGRERAGARVVQRHRIP